MPAGRHPTLHGHTARDCEWPVCWALHAKGSSCGRQLKMPLGIIARAEFRAHVLPALLTGRSASTGTEGCSDSERSKGLGGGP